MAFPIVIYGCESWTIKKAESWRIDAFELWYWRRLLRVPWTAWRSNQSILKEISLEYSLKGLLLKLKLQYFDHLMWRIDSLEKTLMLGKIESRRRRGQQKMRWLDGITNSIDLSLSWWWTGKPGVLQSMGLQTVGQNWANEMYWIFYHIYLRAVLVAQTVNNLLAMQETLVRSWQPTRYGNPRGIWNLKHCWQNYSLVAYMTNAACCITEASLWVPLQLGYTVPVHPDCHLKSLHPSSSVEEGSPQW